MVVKEYKSANKIKVYFPEYNYTTGYIYYSHFKEGSVRSPYCKTVFNIGFLGEGKYTNKSHSKIYTCWKGMLERCYCQKSLNIRPTYQNVTVCEEWHCFQNFAQWYEENYYEIPEEKMELDKDILVKNNKIYGPDTCCFVPHSINTLFTKSNKTRGILPIGIKKYNKKYCAQISKYNNKINLGYYNTIEEAFQKYKETKEEYIKEIANEYSGLIPDDLYFALYNYEVDIDD